MMVPIRVIQWYRFADTIMFFLFAVAFLQTVQPVGTLKYKILSPALQLLEFLQVLWWKFAQLVGFCSIIATDVVSKFSRVELVILISCASWIVLQNVCWKHSVAQFLLGEELFQIIRVTATELKSEERFLWVVAHGFERVKHVLVTFFIVGYSEVWELVDIDVINKN